MRYLPEQYGPTPDYYQPYQLWNLSVSRQFPPVDTGQSEDSVSRFQN